MFDLKDKTILITGARSEMAMSTAELALDLGAKVILTDKNPLSSHPGRQRAARIRFQNDSGKSQNDENFIQLDLADDNCVQKLAAFLNEKKLEVDGLVNVAAVGGASLDTTNPKFFRQVLEINTLAAFKLSQFIAERLKLAGRLGSIVNITTVHAGVPNTDPSYSSSKAALLAVTKSMALSLAKDRIRVNSVAPGAIIGGMNSRLTEAEMQKVSREIPMGSFGEPTDMATLITFLLSDASSYITGQDIKVDGGLSLADSSFNH